MEYAVAHGYLRATKKGYSASRDREIARRRPAGASTDGRGLRELVADMARIGMAVVKGASTDGPRP